MAKQRDRLHIETQEQVAAVTSSIRMRILQAFRDGEATIAELASRLDRTPQSLYHHMHKLVQAGVVIEHHVQRSGKRDEVVYAPAAKEILLKHDRSRQESRDALTQLARTVLRQTGKDVEASIQSGLVIKDGRSRNAKLGRVDALLDRDQIRQVHQLLDQLWDIIGTDGTGPGLRPMFISTFFFPAPQEGARTCP